MDIDIIRIGNSQGIRIPKAMLQQCGLVDKAELTVEDGRIVLQRPRQVRAGWKEAFAEMAKEGEDALRWPEHPLTDLDESDCCEILAP